MRRLPWTFALLLACSTAPLRTAAATTPQAAPGGSAGVGRPHGHGGIRWEPSLTAAKAKAARTGKPLLLLHMFGRLDEAFC
jgi:hypothetical protein